MPKLVKELKDIDVRRKAHRLDALGKPAAAFHNVGGCIRPKTAWWPCKLFRDRQILPLRQPQA